MSAGSTRKRGIKRTPLEIVEALATERFGVGTAISLDRARGSLASGFVGIVWNPGGFVSIATRSHPTKARVIVDLRWILSRPIPVDRRDDQQQATEEVQA